MIKKKNSGEKEYLGQGWKPSTKKSNSNSESTKGDYSYFYHNIIAYTCLHLPPVSILYTVLRVWLIQKTFLCFLQAKVMECEAFYCLCSQKATVLLLKELAKCLSKLTSLAQKLIAFRFLCFQQERLLLMRWNMSKQ